MTGTNDITTAAWATGACASPPDLVRGNGGLADR